MMNIPSVTSKRIQADEIGSFCCRKQKDVSMEHDNILGFGNAAQRDKDDVDLPDRAK